MPSFENMTLPPQAPENSKEQEQKEKEAILQKQKELIASEKETPFVYSKNVLEGIKGDFKKLGVMAASGELSYEQFLEMKLDLDQDRKEVIKGIANYRKELKKVESSLSEDETTLRNNNLLPEPEQLESRISELEKERLYQHQRYLRPKKFKSKGVWVEKNETDKLFDAAYGGSLTQSELFSANISEDDRLVASLVLDLVSEFNYKNAKREAYSEIVFKNGLRNH